MATESPKRNSLRHALEATPFLQGVALIALIFALLLLSQGQAHRLGRSGEDRPVRIVSALVPPHMDDKGEGREAEIIEAALRRAYPGKPIEFFVLPFSRHWSSYLSDERFDAVTTVPATIDLPGYRSSTYLSYQNGVLYRCSDVADNDRPVDLSTFAGARVVGFAGAENILPGLAERIDDFTFYVERKNQRSQAALLLQGQVDAVIADGAIFNYYAEQVAEGSLAGQPADTGFAPIFPKTDYQMVFRSERLRDLFDDGLARLGSATLARMSQKYYPAAEGSCR